ncbi:MAG: hypothetical protein RLY31_107 [Bacteroidota bacterium]
MKVESPRLETPFPLRGNPDGETVPADIHDLTSVKSALAIRETDDIASPPAQHLYTVTGLFRTEPGKPVPDICGEKHVHIQVLFLR